MSSLSSTVSQGTSQQTGNSNGKRPAESQAGATDKRACEPVFKVCIYHIAMMGNKELGVSVDPVRGCKPGYYGNPKYVVRDRKSTRLNSSH